MESKGIRVYVKQNDTVRVELSDILKEVQNGDRFYWSILEIEASGYLGEGRTYKQLEEEVNDSTNGFYITWDDLNSLSKKFNQVVWITIIGCEDKNLLRCYANDQEMYSTCDFVIVMFDGWFFEIFTKEKSLIDQLKKKIQ